MVERRDEDFARKSKKFFESSTCLQSNFPTVANFFSSFLSLFPVSFLHIPLELVPRKYYSFVVTHRFLFLRTEIVTFIFNIFSNEPFSHFLHFHFPPFCFLASFLRLEIFVPNFFLLSALFFVSKIFRSILVFQQTTWSFDQIISVIG